MRNTLLIIILSLGYSWAANAQTTLQELESTRIHYQKEEAKVHTKVTGLNLQAINEDIVGHISTKGYPTSTSTTATRDQLAIRDPKNPSKVLMKLQAGAQVVVYERVGKNSFLVRTDNDNIGLIDVNAFGSALQSYPLEVLIQSQSPEEQEADDLNGVILQEKISPRMKNN